MHSLTNIQKSLLPFLLATALFMEMLDSTVLNTAIPSIALEFGVSAIIAKSAVTAYLVTLAMFIPISGYIADRFGQRNVFAFSFSLFVVGSLFSGLSMNLTQLIISRSLQGLGGSLLLSIGRLILVSNYRKSELAKVFPYVTIPGLLGVVLGPSIGGIITENLGWRYIFFVNIPIGILVIVGSFFLVRNIKRDSEKIDKVGFLFLAFGLGLLIFSCERISVSLSLGNFSMILASFLILYYSYLRTKGKRSPILDTSLLQYESFKVATQYSILNRISFPSVPLLLPISLQTAAGFTPSQSGLLMLPIGLGAMSVKFFVRPLLTNFGYRSVLFLNTLAMSAVILLFAVFDNPYQTHILLLLCFSFGMCSSIQYSTLAILSYEEIPDHELTRATTLETTIRQVCSGFAICIMGIFLFFYSLIIGNVGEISHYTIDLTFLSLSILCALTSIPYYNIPTFKFHFDSLKAD